MFEIKTQFIIKKEMAKKFQIKTKYYIVACSNAIFYNKADG